MNKTTFWLLDAAIEYYLPLPVLAAEDVGLRLNRVDHNLSMTELANHLHALVAQGFIMLFAVERAQYPDESDFVPIASAMDSAIEAGLRGKRDIRYGLTPTGGRLWEDVARPRWQHFIHVSFSDDPPGHMHAQHRRMIEAYVAAENAVGSGTFVVDDTTWQIVAPWHVTYWKTLPQGVFVQVRYTWNDKMSENSDISEHYKRLDNLTHWYDNPFV